MKIKRLLIAGIFAVVVPLLSGCWTVAAAGAGAYGGYKMKEEGYTLQNPVTKEENKKSTK
ncbi:hypothetical protein [Nitrosomonas sp.]|uniref:hypothetical protein n=1 Tax=Nitrosomonas sp. TaxID=42353 RepID=UPI001D6AB7A9|nr:hypothetical protein [Nitrosomonas sp.]MBX3617552.1 hypothetical protein [Nitrosomonas sp.]